MSADAAVDNVASQLANTSLNNTTGDTGATTTEHEPIAQSAIEGRRLYIGNLAYATTKEELQKFFSDFQVEESTIPTNPRTTRPVGYAFVDVKTADEAQRAIELLNGKMILERKVSVQLARKPDENPAEGDEQVNGDSRRRQSGRGRGRGRGRGGRAGRGGRGRGAGFGEENGEEAPINIPGQAAPLAETTQGNNIASNEAEDADKKSRGPLRLRNRGPPEDGVPSKTKVMVANLPYDIQEERLLEVFKEYQPTSAKVALRPIPRFMIRKLLQRGEPRKGRGFAFITLPSEEVQQKVIAEMNGKNLDGRELAVKVAIDSPGKEEDALNAQADAETGKENGASAETPDGTAATA